MEKNDKQRDVISKVLKSYPDVEKNLKGKEEFNSDKMLDIMHEYIEQHKWLINENIPFVISLEQAFFSWYENVYYPQWAEMTRTNICKDFPEKTLFEVFDKVSKEHFFLKQESSGGQILYETACYRVIARESKSSLRRSRAKRKLKRTH